MNDYHYNDNEIANLLLFAKFADEYYVIYNTRVNDTIYVQSKDDRKYLWFQGDPKYSLYYMDISKAKVDGHCYFSTLKKKMMFSILDQK